MTAEDKAAIERINIAQDQVKYEPIDTEELCAHLDDLCDQLSSLRNEVKRQKLTGTIGGWGGEEVSIILSDGDTLNLPEIPNI